MLYFCLISVFLLFGWNFRLQKKIKALTESNDKILSVITDDEKLNQLIQSKDVIAEYAEGVKNQIVTYMEEAKNIKSDLFNEKNAIVQKKLEQENLRSNPNNFPFNYDEICLLIEQALINKNKIKNGMIYSTMWRVFQNSCEKGSIYFNPTCQSETLYYFSERNVFWKIWDKIPCLEKFSNHADPNSYCAILLTPLEIQKIISNYRKNSSENDELKSKLEMLNQIGS